MKRICACNGVFLIVLVNMALAQSVAGLESLVDRLEHPLWTARLDAALAIAAGGPAATDAIPALTRTLDDVNIQVRRAAVQALADVGVGSAAALPGLLHALSDDDWVVRR
ncbi:MAG: HEAT repeat domain-containing protein, partial [Proteobacteria bacterium]|nr:HEAT repeat domain-containing protein [Pseudomonadota bacterium]